MRSGQQASCSCQRAGTGTGTESAAAAAAARPHRLPSGVALGPAAPQAARAASSAACAGQHVQQALEWSGWQRSSERQLELVSVSSRVCDDIGAAAAGVRPGQCPQRPRQPDAAAATAARACGTQQQDVKRSCVPRLQASERAFLSTAYVSGQPQQRLHDQAGALLSVGRWCERLLGSCCGCW